VAVRTAVAAVCALAFLGLVVACGDEEDGGAGISSEALPETAASTEAQVPPLPTLEQLSDPVRTKRAAILAAAEARDYDAIEALIEPEVFLSDAGFGVDPVPHWRDLGAAPLETMQALLNFGHTVEEGNEGRLYQWPRFNENSSPAEMQPDERDKLVALLGEDGLVNAFQEETGYVGPRLGILADGTWWFLILESGP
jgi:hypothetical protein